MVVQDNTVANVCVDDDVAVPRGLYVRLERQCFSHAW